MVFVGGGGGYHRIAFRARSVRARVFGFIGFSCAAQYFLCVLSNFQRQFWEMSFNKEHFYVLLLLHFSSSDRGWERKFGANYFNNVCKYFDKNAMGG